MARLRVSLLGILLLRKTQTNEDIKNAFNNLLEQAKQTESRMRDILDQAQTNNVDDSTDEKWLRLRTPTEYVNISMITFI